MSADGYTRRRYLRGVSSVVGGLALAGCRGNSDTPAGDATTPTVGTPPTAETSPTARDPVHADYETTTVRVETEGGGVLGTVTAAIADTPELRYTGLSETDSLPEGRGMLFVYESVAERTFVMREMAFGIDIVFADDDRTITTIHHAPAPGPNEDGSEQRYPGRGQYVLEVTYDWTTERGVSEGDRLVFSL